MDITEKIAKLHILLSPVQGELLPDDEALALFLSLAEDEILNWRYAGNIPDDVIEVPARFVTTQLMAVVTGLSIAGNEGQKSGNENGISRSWKYSDMVEYIRKNVPPLAEVT